MCAAHSCGIRSGGKPPSVRRERLGVRLVRSPLGGFQSMGPIDTMARMRCWPMRPASTAPFAASDHVGSRGGPPRLAKDVLGAAATLAAIGAFLLQVSNLLARPCGAKLNQRVGSGACSGISAIASHAHEIVTLSVIACTALAAVAFIWYMLWGYKT